MIGGVHLREKLTIRQDKTRVGSPKDTKGGKGVVWRLCTVQSWLVHDPPESAMMFAFTDKM